MRVTEYTKKEGKQLSMMEIANRIQKQVNPLAYNLERTGKLLKMAENLDPTKRWPQYLALKDLVTQYSKTLPMNNIYLNNNAMITIRELVDSISTNIVALESLKVAVPSQDFLKAARSISGSSTQFVFPKGWGSGSEVSELNSVMSRLTKSIEQHSQFGNLKSFKVLSDLNNLSFKEVLNVDLTQEDLIEFSSKSISEIDSNLNDEVKTGKDFNLYSDEAKKRLSYIFHTYLLPVFYIIIGILMTPHIQQAQEELKILTTQKEVKSFTRSPPATFDCKALKGYRFTMVNNLNLRESNGIDSNIIEILPIGTTVRVIDKSDRSWLLVEVEINGELEQGWVLRRYTTYFK